MQFPCPEQSTLSLQVRAQFGPRKPLVQRTQLVAGSKFNGHSQRNVGVGDGSPSECVVRRFNPLPSSSSSSSSCVSLIWWQDPPLHKQTSHSLPPYVLGQRQEPSLGCGIPCLQIRVVELCVGVEGVGLKKCGVV